MFAEFTTAREGDSFQHSATRKVQFMKLTVLFCLAAVAGLSCEAAAQQAPAPSISAGTPQTLPRPDSHFDGNVGRTYLESDTPQFP
jgi:hypothetical protein